MLFASSAANLVPVSNSSVSGVYLPGLQVYLRNRSKGTTTLISASQSGWVGVGGDSIPLGISANGHLALFESSAVNLVVGDINNVADIFVRDLIAGTNCLVSANTNGVPGNGTSRNATSSLDGRYVAFASSASDLVPGDTNGVADIFVRDLVTGVTTLASTWPLVTNVSAAPGASDHPEISADGRYVVFSSVTIDLNAGVQIGSDIYLRDLLGNATVQVSAGGRAVALANWGITNLNCYGHRLSSDGQFVIYESCPVTPTALTAGMVFRYGVQSGVTDLVATNAAAVTPDYGEIHSLDLSSDGKLVAFIISTNAGAFGATCVCLWNADNAMTTLVSADLTGSIQSNTQCSIPTLDPDGKWVFFLSSATNLVGTPTDAGFHLYRHDLVSGTNILVDLDLAGIGSVALSPTACYSASTDGNRVSFEAPDGNLVVGDNNRNSDVFFRDLGGQQMELISQHDLALPSLTPNRPAVLLPNCISSNGQFVVFTSEASNLTVNDTNNCRDVFVRDLVNGANTQVSIASDGISSANLFSTEPVISADGRYVAFTSFATNLVAGVTNQFSHVYVRDLLAGTTTLVSISTNGTVGNGASRMPWISADGRFVAFRSLARNLVKASFGSGDMLYVRNLQSATTYALTTNSAVLAFAATPDGHFVVYGAGNSIFVWNSAAATSVVYTNSASGLNDLAISQDGTRILFRLGGQIRAVDFTTRSVSIVATSQSGSTAFVISTNRDGLRFSADGRYAVFASTGIQGSNNTNGTLSQVYLFDFQTRTNLLISQQYGVPLAGEGRSDSPEISSDGRLIAYRSQSARIVPGDNNGAGDLFLYDRQSGTTTLVNDSPAGSGPANQWSINAFFSGDGHTLVFQSWASDLFSGDFNQTGDIYALSLPASTNGAFSFNGTIQAGAPSRLVWPTVPGRNYSVQFKNALTDPAWQNFNGSISIVGNQGTAVDFGPSSGQRFYRVVAY